MLFQEPTICFVTINPFDTIYTSGANYAVCQKVGGSNLSQEMICALPGMPAGTTQETICKWVENTYPDAVGGNIDPSYVPPDPDPTTEPSTALKNAIDPATQPNATAAPARSAPHFNNNLFN